MYEPQPPRKFRDATADTNQPLRVSATLNPYVDLHKLSQADLYQLKAQIDIILPEDSFATLNLEQELVKQFRTASALQAEVINGNEESNKKAQVMNSVAAILGQLVKLQADLHTTERLKAIENHLIETLKTTVPEEYVQAFFEKYESGAIMSTQED